MAIHWSWFSFVIGISTIILIEALMVLATITVVAIRVAKRKRQSHPLFRDT